VVVPTLGRPERLCDCLRSLGTQTIAPKQVIVVWQAEDVATREHATRMRSEVSYHLEVVHSPRANMVEALNAGMAAAGSDVILRIDDDAVAPSHWIERHLTLYRDGSVGAVGGPYDNLYPDDSPFPKQTHQPVGKLTWYGKLFGNMFDQDPTWRQLPVLAVDHLIGANLSLRRGAFDEYDPRLKPYWQMNELDICLQVKSRGYRVLFDFNNIVKHHPSSEYAVPGRDGNLDLKVYNSAYNHALILAKHTRRHLKVTRLLYLLAVGSVGAPGLVGSLIAIKRYGKPGREAIILAKTWKHHIAGWRAGTSSCAQIAAGHIPAASDHGGARDCESA